MGAAGCPFPRGRTGTGADAARRLLSSVCGRDTGRPVRGDSPADRLFYWSPSSFFISAISAVCVATTDAASVRAGA
ncbi:hypothetical protein GCM10018787_03190 [Streptomyces thermodiastaticus]|nr:hypothetical protein GCM10018787_03190 [Streptomyces thermodiastaticus]